MPSERPLTKDEKDFVNFIEQWWHSHDKINEKIPSTETIQSQLANNPKHGNVKINERPVANPDGVEGYWDNGKVGRFLKSGIINEALERRGIILADLSMLRPEQLAAANAILDFSDHRSQKTKLNELGISTTQYAAWLKQPNFQRYVKQRAEALLGDVQHEAHASLLKNVQRGDLNSIKLYYELTGRWSSKTVGDLNVEFLIIKVIESIQKHVREPEVISAIAEDLNGILNGVPNSGVAIAQAPPVVVSRVADKAIEDKPLPAVVDTDPDIPSLF